MSAGKEHMVRMPLSSRLLFAFVGIALPVGAHMADFFTNFSSAYAITQMTAILYPGTGFYDPEFASTNGFLLGLPRQMYFNFVSLAITALASWLALRNGRNEQAAP